MSGELKGIRVLDLSQFLSGPRAGQILADLGAEVIKVEPPTGETMRLLTMLIPGAERVNSILNRNKKGIAIDFRKTEGAELFARLVAEADVVIENFAFGALEKYNLGYERLRSINPKLVFASISGFGRSGPLTERLAFDIIAQASAGIMHAYRQEDRPPAIFFADLVSGAFCAIGVMAALIERANTGRGKRVDVSMQDVMYSHNFGCLSERALEPVAELIEKTIGRPMLSMLTDHDNPVPFWNSYRAADGYVAMVALTDRQWRSMLLACGLNELADDPQLANFPMRIKNSKLAIGAITAWTSKKTVDEIVTIMVEAGVPAGPVADYPRVNSDPQLKARNMIEKIDHPRLGEIGVPGMPIRLDDQPSPIETPCPELGEHTAAICAELLGLADSEIAELKRIGAIA